MNSLILNTQNQNQNKNGLKYICYNGNMNDNPTFFATASLYNSRLNNGYVTDLSSLSASTNGCFSNGLQTNISVQWLGYFKSNYSGIWTFSTNSDDCSYLWLGNNALSGYTTGNALINNSGTHGMVIVTNTINLLNNTYYPIRIQFGQGTGGLGMIVSFSNQNLAVRANGNGYYFSNNQNGLQYICYNGYMSDNPNFFTTASLYNNSLNNGYVTDLSSLSASTNGCFSNGLQTNISVQWLGYFKSNYSGTWTFSTNSDDCSYLWLGDNALSGYTTSNALINNGGLHAMNKVTNTINLSNNTYYPIRIQFGQDGGGAEMIVTISNPNLASRTDGNGYYFANNQ